MRIEIHIPKSRVYDEVSKQAEFSAGRHMILSDGEASDKVSDAVVITEQDRILLDDYWRETCAQAILGLHRWLASDSLNNEMLRLEFALPENWDTSQNEAAKEHIRGYIVQMILSRWLLTAAGMGNTEVASAATAAAEMASTKMTEALRALAARVAPARRYLKKDYYDKGLL